ncbi:MAG: hypothetical protein WCG25_09375 [bacterium]
MKIKILNILQSSQMRDFPKKYNYHIVEKEIQDKNKKFKDYKSKNLSQIYSDLIPISDQLHL